MHNAQRTLTRPFHLFHPVLHLAKDTLVLVTLLDALTGGRIKLPRSRLF